MEVTVIIRDEERRQINMVTTMNKVMTVIMVMRSLRTVIKVKLVTIMRMVVVIMKL